jgi:nitrate/nitrite-specific signal transduction histidine kinase
VRLSEAPACVALTVEDDGIGLRAQEREGGDHFGLRIMRERVQSIGGELKAESRPGQGTSLQVLVPTGVTTVRREEELWSAFGS